MKLSEFYIGLEFIAEGGFKWRCTDVGSRTVLAIRLDRKDPNWYQGPPYIAEEAVFDEKEIEHSHLNNEDALTAAIHEYKSSGHPGYPTEVVTRMLKARRSHRYRNPGVLRFDRRRSDGEILHPYAAQRAADEWIVELYLPFLGTYDQMTEREFIALPLASKSDILARSCER
jgi:hypothetical protein